MYLLLSGVQLLKPIQSPQGPVTTSMSMHMWQILAQLTFKEADWILPYIARFDRATLWSLTHANRA